MRPLVGDATRKFLSFGEIRDYLKGTGLTVNEIYDPAEGVFPKSGSQRARFIRRVSEDVQQHYGEEFALRFQRYNFKDVKEYDEFVRRSRLADGSFKGLPIFDAEKAAVLRVVNKRTGDEKDLREIEEFLRRSQGWGRGAEGGKLYKRIKALFNSKSYSIMPRDPLKVAVFDTQHSLSLAAEEAALLAEGFDRQTVNRLLEESAASAMDGISVMSKNTAVRFRDEMASEVAVLERELGKATGFQKSHLRRELDAFIRSLDQLDKMIETGKGVGQLRATGFDIDPILNRDVVGKDLMSRVEQLRKKYTLLKGNYIIAREGVLPPGVDILTDIRNLTDQFGLDPEGIDQEFLRQHLETAGGGRFASIDPFARPAAARGDPQIMSSIPELFHDFGQSIEDLKAGLATEVDELRRTGRLPTEMRRMLERDVDEYYDLFSGGTREMGSVSWAAQSEAEAKMLQAREILELADEGKLNQYPAMMKQLISARVKSLERNKRGARMLNMDIPFSVRAEMISSLPAEIAENPELLKTIMRGEEVSLSQARRTLSYNPRLEALVAPVQDLHWFLRAHGGADFDDALIASLRWDDRTNTIQALGYRTPQTRGEASMLRVLPEDELMAEAFRLRGDETLSKMLAQEKHYVSEFNRVSDRVASRDVASSQLQSRYVNAAENLETLRQQRMQHISRYLPHMTEEERAVPRLGFQHGRYVGVDPEYIDRAEVLRAHRTATELHDTQRRVFRIQGDAPGNWYEEFNEVEVPKTASPVKPIGKMADDELAGYVDRMVKSGRIGVKNQAILGTWVNAQILRNHIFSQIDIEEIRRQFPEMPRTLQIEIEKILDAATQGKDFGFTMDDVAQRAKASMAEAVEALAYAKHLGVDAGIDPALFYGGRLTPVGELTDAPAARQYDIPEIRNALARVRSVTGTTFNLDLPDQGPGQSVMMSMQDPKAIYSQELMAVEEIAEQGEVYLREVAEDARRQFADIETGDRAQRDARNIIRRVRKAEQLEKAKLWEDVALQGVDRRSSEVRLQVRREVLDEVSQLFERSGEAGPRVARALIETSKTTDISQHLMGTKLWRFASDFAATGDMEGFLPQKLPRVEDIWDATGTVTRHGYGVQEHINDILRADPLNRGYTAQMMEDVTQGFDITRKAMDLTYDDTPRLARRLANIEGAAVVAAEGFYGPMDPRTMVRRGGGTVESMGEMLLQSMYTEDEALAREIRESMIGMYESLAAEPAELPDPMRRMLIHSAEGAEAPGIRQAGDSARAVQEAIDVMAPRPTPYSRAGFDTAQRFFRTPGGRLTGLGALAMVGASLVHTVRKRDRTPEDMAGPEFLPGGNPYDGQQSNRISGSDPITSLQTDPTMGMGTTYEVRAARVEDSNAFLEMVASITGAQPSATIYPRPEAPQFKSETSRERILRRNQ